MIPDIVVQVGYALLILFVTIGVIWAFVPSIIEIAGTALFAVVDKILSYFAG